MKLACVSPLQKSMNHKSGKMDQ